jgi:hypothetical protein
MNEFLTSILHHFVWSIYSEIPVMPEMHPVINSDYTDGISDLQFTR